MKTFTLTIDGRAYEVDADGKNLLQVCLSLGLNLPYFCWHPALHSVGACRQCAVKLYKDEADARGRIVMSCMTPVTDNMRLSIEDAEARSFRGQVTELLMVNHPHDCPVCDEGGECHLQDMTVMTGHDYRRYRFTKRTYRNQDLGPFVNHEMNRCIQCYRCVRFYRDVAGGRDLDAQGAHDHVYFGRQSDGPLESEFSGNLVEVCPTGVFTDKTLRSHYTRKWDLQTAPSVCPHCAVGCATIPGERYGTLRRIRNRFNGEVNGYFLCDRGRYGYEFVNASTRLRAPLKAGAEVSGDDALSAAAAALSGKAVVAIGSPRASLETNFALRALAGAGRMFLPMSDERFELLGLMARVLRDGPAPAASVKQAAAADAVLVLGEDTWNSAPVLGLALRQASTNVPVAGAMKEKKIFRWDDAALRQATRYQKGPLFLATVSRSTLDDSALESFRVGPEQAAALGHTVAHALDASAPAPAAGTLTAELAAAAGRIAAALKAAERPLVVSGAGMSSAAVVEAAANVARALKKAGRDARIHMVFPEANSLGALLLAAGGLQSAAKALAAAPGSALVVAEADLFRADAAAAAALCAAAGTVVAIEHTRSRTTEAAGVVLPAATFAESTGTLVNSEGRAQRFFSVFPPAEPLAAAWRWVDRLAVAAGTRARAWQSVDDVLAALAAEMPELEGARRAAPDADYRILGRRVPRKSLRESGRTAVTAHLDVREPRPAADPDSPLSYSMEGTSRGAPGALLARAWTPGWNSDSALNKFQAEVGGPLVGGDPGVRLFEPPAEDRGTWWPARAAAARGGDAELTLLLRPHVLGSEELSLLTPGVTSRAPRPYVALSRADASRRGLEEGDALRVAGAAEALPLLVADIPDGVALVPEGIVPAAPGRTRVEKARGGGKA